MNALMEMDTPSTTPTLSESNFPLPSSANSSKNSSKATSPILLTKDNKPTSMPILTRRGHSSPVKQSPPGRGRRSKKSNSKATTLDLGDSIVLPKYGSVLRGFVRYIGKVHFATGGGWVGVELLDPTRLTKLRHTAPDKKLHDGSVGGVRYFQAEKRKSSLFVRRTECLVTAKHGRRILGKQKYKSMAVMKGGNLNQSNSTGKNQLKFNSDSSNSPNTRQDRQFSLSSSLNFHRTKSNDSPLTSLSARNSEIFETENTIAIQSPPIGGRRRSNSWSGETEEKATRVWSESMVFDNHDSDNHDSDDDEKNEKNEKIINNNNNNNNHSNVSHAMDLDLVTLKNMVDSLTTDREEAVHHLEIVERAMEEEREKHRRDVKERDNEIVHLRHMLRQQYTLELPLPPNSPAMSSTVLPAASQVTQDGQTLLKRALPNVPTRSEGSDGSSDSENDSDGEVAPITPTSKRPSLWARRRKSTGAAFLLRVMADTTSSPKRKKEQKNQNTNNNTSTSNSSTTLRPPTIVTIDAPTPIPIKKTARNSMLHLRLDSVANDSSNNDGLVDDTTNKNTNNSDDDDDDYGQSQHAHLHTDTVDLSYDKLKTRGFEIDAFGIVSTPKGDYKRNSTSQN